MGIQSGRSIGFTTTPLTPATESSFWTQNFSETHSPIFAGDALALSRLIAGSTDQPRISITIDGYELATGGFPGRKRVSDVKSPVAAIEDAEEELSLDIFPESLRTALEKDDPTDTEIKAAFNAFRTSDHISPAKKSELLMSDFVRKHPSNYLRSALQEATFSNRLSKERSVLEIGYHAIVDMLNYNNVNPLLILSAALIDGTYTQPMVSYLICKQSDESIAAIVKNTDYDKTRLVDCLLRSEAHELYHGHNYKIMGAKVWDAALSVLPNEHWLTRWRVQSRRRNWLVSQRDPSWTALRNNDLSLIRHENLTKEGAVRPLRKDNPTPEEIDRAVAEIMNLPTSIIVELLEKIVRIHPSGSLRNSIVKRIASQHFQAAVYEAAAIIDSTWSYKAVERLVSARAWTEVGRVLRTADTQSPQDLVWAVWQAHKEGQLVPKHVAEAALKKLPPQAIIWKSRMKKFI